MEMIGFDDALNILSLQNWPKLTVCRICRGSRDTTLATIASTNLGAGGLFLCYNVIRPWKTTALLNNSTANFYFYLPQLDWIGLDWNGMDKFKRD